MNNTKYASGYHPSQPYVQKFWQIITEMSPEDQGFFLKFVTSCERQPLLGFSKMYPPFCIQQVILHDEVRLPSAATCMNLLKLPKYENEDVLKEKLLYAVRSNSGFELS